jgi:hypothetical protein
MISLENFSIICVDCWNQKKYFNLLSTIAIGYECI